MKRVRIIKESTPKTLEESIAIYVDEGDVVEYISLLKRTWPRTKVELSRKKVA